MILDSFLSHSAPKVPANAVGFTFKMHPESNHFLPPPPCLHWPKPPPSSLPLDSCKSLELDSLLHPQALLSGLQSVARVILLTMAVGIQHSSAQNLSTTVSALRMAHTEEKPGFCQGVLVHAPPDNEVTFSPHSLQNTLAYPGNTVPTGQGHPHRRASTLFTSPPGTPFFQTTRG